MGSRNFLRTFKKLLFLIHCDPKQNKCPMKVPKTKLYINYPAFNSNKPWGGPHGAPLGLIVCITNQLKFSWLLQLISLLFSRKVIFHRVKDISMFIKNAGFSGIFYGFLSNFYGIHLILKLIFCFRFGCCKENWIFWICTKGNCFQKDCCGWLWTTRIRNKKMLYQH